MRTTIDAIVRQSVGALMLITMTTGSALAAQDYDPERAFIESLAGRQSPSAIETIPSSGTPSRDPARDFIQHLAGTLDRSAVSGADFDSHPQQNLVDHLAGRIERPSLSPKTGLDAERAGEFADRSGNGSI